MTVNHSSYEFSLADKHTSHTGGASTCIKMSGISWLTQLWHSIQLAGNVMLCMRKAHLLWGYRYCLVLTTSAETNRDNDHALLCMNNCTFHAFMGGWEKERMSISWVRETSTRVFCRNYEHHMCPHRTQLQQGQLRSKLWLKTGFFQCLPNAGSAWKYLSSAFTLLCVALCIPRTVLQHL